MGKSLLMRLYGRPAQRHLHERKPMARFIRRKKNVKPSMATANMAILNKISVALLRVAGSYADFSLKIKRRLGIR